MSLSPAAHACAPLVKRPAAESHRSAARSADQFYTKQSVADHCLGIVSMHFDIRAYRLFEPSAGKGAFYKRMPQGSVGIDIAPKYPGIMKADFFEYRIKSDRPVGIVGNPPFGRNASLAVRFVNRGSHQADFIAMILPRSFRKASIENRVDRYLHLLYEEVLPRDSFEFEGKQRNVPSVFQIWVRRSWKRKLRPVVTKHRDFDLGTPEDCDFVVQRVGARAGRVHDNKKASPNSHYFIKAKVPGVRQVMAKLNLATPAADATGNPSLAKSELVASYDRARYGGRQTL